MGDALFALVEVAVSELGGSVRAIQRTHSSSAIVWWERPDEGCHATHATHAASVSGGKAILYWGHYGLTDSEARADFTVRAGRTDP